MSEFSIILRGGESCNAKCHYCSGRLCDHETVEWDLPEMEKKMRTNPIITGAIAKGEEIQFNLWGGEPTLHLKEYDKIMAYIDEHFKDLKYSWFISTNGLLLGDKEVVKWIYDHHVNLQLSHDGLGQWIRTKSFDPFYNDATKDVVVQLVKDGLLTMFNATLNKYNCSPIGNVFYFNKWRYDNHLENYKLLIKPNHINDSQYADAFSLTGPELDRYIHEIEILFQDAYVANDNDPWWSPYKDYFLNQMTRWDLYNGNNNSCGNFMIGKQDWTWVINTKGEYVACQLWDTNVGMPNPDLHQPDYCKECEFKDMNECHPCPNMLMAKECHYKKAYARLMLRMKNYIRHIDELRKNNNGQRNCNCHN